MSMTVKEAKEARAIMERAIAEIVAEFHGVTGLKVRELYLKVDSAHGPDGVETDVRYSVNAAVVL